MRVNPWMSFWRTNLRRLGSLKHLDEMLFRVRRLLMSLQD